MKDQLTQVTQVSDSLSAPRRWLRTNSVSVTVLTDKPCTDSSASLWYTAELGRHFCLEVVPCGHPFGF